MMGLKTLTNLSAPLFDSATSSRRSWFRVEVEIFFLCSSGNKHLAKLTLASGHECYFSSRM